MAKGTAGAQVAFLLVVCSLPLPAQVRDYLLRHDPRALQIARSFNTPQAPLQIANFASDPAGYLWLASIRGLFRFDGQHLHQFSTLPVNGVAVTQDGRVWTATDEGLQAIRRGEKRKIHDTSFDSVVARGSEIVAAGGGGVWRGSIDHFERVGTARANGPLALDRTGNAWFGCGLDLCALAPDGSLTKFSAADGVPRQRWSAAVRDDVGNLWAWDTHRVVKIAHGKAVTVDDYPATTETIPSFAAIRRPDGQIQIGENRWIDTHGAYHAASWPTSMDLLRQSYAEDHLKQLWMGSTSRGVSLMSPKTWITGWQLNADIPAEPVITLRTGSGAILSATTVGLTQLDTATDSWKLLPGAFSSDAVVSFAEASGGGFWVLFRNWGIQRIDGRGRVTADVPWAGMKGTEYRVFYRDRLGVLWLAAKKELYRLDETSARLVPWPLPVPGGSAVAFAKSNDGEEWLGYEGGILRRTATNWELVVPSSALWNPRVRRIAVGPGPSFWVCYRTTGPFSYVYREGEQWKRRDFSAEQGYGSTNTWSLLRDRRGWIWCGSENGLLVSDGVHLEPQDWIRLTETHNLPSGEIAHFGLNEDRDGAIWVTTSRGPAKIEPDPTWFTLSASEPRVTRMRWHGVDNFWPGETPQLDGPGTVELDFARWPGPTPRPAGTEYRLMPRDERWRLTQAGTARYDDLPAGNYRFEMRSAEGGPVKVFAFQVTGGIQSAWLWLMAGAFLPAGAAFSYWRVRRRKIVTDYWTAKREYLSRNPEAAFSDAALLGTTISSRYRLESVLGEGGFSSVYLGVDLQTDTQVAVKVLHNQSELPGWQRKRFESETSALAAIRHPGIVEMLDSGFIDDREPYLVMRYVAGPSLRAVLRDGAVDRITASRWIEQLGIALAAAHANGVIHRDLKPENIIVETIPDEGQRLVIVDFGAATIQTADTPSGTTIMLVSRDYAAPERIQGKSSPATDVYALAAIAFEMLTGVRYASLADSSVAGLRHALVGFPDSVIELLASGATFDPANRPSDIAEFSAKLAQLLRHSN